MLVQQKDDYHKLLDNVPNLSSARYRGRLIAYATYIINYKSDKEVAERSAKESSSNYYDRFIQEAYNIANEEERDLIRKLRFLVEKKYGTKMKTLLWVRRRLQKSFVAIHGICCIKMKTPMIRIYQKRKTVQKIMCSSI